MDVAQIQIVPVDNGFFVQMVNADGSGTYHPRKVATTREELVTIIKDIADVLFTKEPAPQPGQQPIPGTSGPIQTQPSPPPQAVVSGP